MSKGKNKKKREYTKEEKAAYNKKKNDKRRKKIKEAFKAKRLADAIVAENKHKEELDSIMKKLAHVEEKLESIESHKKAKSVETPASPKSDEDETGKKISSRLR